MQTAQKVQVKFRKKTFVIILVITILSILSVLGYLVYKTSFFNEYFKKGVEEQPEVKKELDYSGSSMSTKTYTFVSNEEIMHAPSVSIRSWGGIYKKELILDEDNKVELFILPSYYLSTGGNTNSIDVVVAVLLNEDYTAIPNTWLNNISFYVENIESLKNEFFELENLEEIFKENTTWNYDYYINSSQPVIDEYLIVIKKVIEEYDYKLGEVEELLLEGKAEGILLMPTLILEAL